MPTFTYSNSTVNYLDNVIAKEGVSVSHLGGLRLEQILKIVEENFVDIDDYNSHNHSGVYLPVGGGAWQGDETLLITSDDGTLQIGPQNTSYCHFSTDRNAHYFNKKIEVDTSLGVYGSNTIITDGKVTADSNCWLTEGEVKLNSEGFLTHDEVAVDDGDKLQIVPTSGAGGIAMIHPQADGAYHAVVMFSRDSGGTTLTIISDPEGVVSMNVDGVTIEWQNQTGDDLSDVHVSYMGRRNIIVSSTS